MLGPPAAGPAEGGEIASMGVRGKARAAARHGAWGDGRSWQALGKAWGLSSERPGEQGNGPPAGNTGLGELGDRVGT